MSLILEALKKSEQQRRLGEAPTLGSLTLATRKRRSVLPLLAALIALALGVGWWLTRTPATPASNPSVAAVTRTAPAPRSAPLPNARPPAATPGRPAAGNETSANRERAIPSAPAQPHEAASAPRVLAPAAGAPGAQGRPGAAGLPPNARLVTTPAAAPGKVATVAPPPAAVAAATPANASASAASVNPPAAGTPKADRISAPAATASVPTRPQQPARPVLPTVWDLPYATRKDLPDLSLTMHVYAADPHQRFVVIKGDRHVEGDDLGSGVTLREIRADGMVLEFKGQRFVYPRDGR